MIVQTMHICLLRRFSLPIELRIIIELYTILKVNNETIRMAVKNYPCASMKLKHGLIEWWDTSEVTDMTLVFFGKNNSFDISNWNVCNVTDMSGMFHCSTFNHPLNTWNVSKVTNMRGMFNYATSFNQPLHNWDVSNVTDMTFMFKCAHEFNQPIGKWNVAKVTYMNSMFAHAMKFNQSINAWNVPVSTDVFYMFLNADSFEQELSGKWKQNQKLMFVKLPPKASSWKPVFEKYIKVALLVKFGLEITDLIVGTDQHWFNVGMAIFWPISLPVACFLGWLSLNPDIVFILFGWLLLILYCFA